MATNDITTVTPEIVVDGATSANVDLTALAIEILLDHQGNQITTVTPEILLSVTTANLDLGQLVLEIAIDNPAQPQPPSPPGFLTRTLTQSDTWELDHGLQNWPGEFGTPLVWWETTLPHQRIGLTPTPGDVGTIGLLYTALAQLLTGTGGSFTIPDDWTPYVIWGALAELLGADGPAYDPVRAQYCQRRYDEGVELARLVLRGK